MKKQLFLFAAITALMVCSTAFAQTADQGYATRAEVDSLIKANIKKAVKPKNTVQKPETATVHYPNTVTPVVNNYCYVGPQAMPEDMSIRERVSRSRFPLLEAAACSWEATVEGINNSRRGIIAIFLILLTLILIAKRRLLFRTEPPKN